MSGNFPPGCTQAHVDEAMGDGQYEQEEREMLKLITTAKVITVDGHDHVHVWNKGGKAGTLIVKQGDGEEIADRLLADVVGLLAELAQQADHVDKAIVTICYLERKLVAANDLILAAAQHVADAARHAADATREGNPAEAVEDPADAHA